MVRTSGYKLLCECHLTEGFIVKKQDPCKSDRGCIDKIFTSKQMSEKEKKK